MVDKEKDLEQIFRSLDSIAKSENKREKDLEQIFRSLDSIVDAETNKQNQVNGKAATETPNTPSYINSTGVMDYERNWPSREDAQEVLNEQTWLQPTPEEWEDSSLLKEPEARKVTNKPQEVLDEQTWLQPTPEEWTTPMSQEQVEQYNQSKRNFNEELQATKKEVDSQLQGARKGLDDLRKKDPLGFSLPTHSFTSGISYGSRDTKTNAKTWDAAEATLSKVQRRINNYESDSSREYGVVPMVEGLVSTLVGEWLPEVVTQGSVEFGRQEEKMKLAKQLSDTQDKISTNNTQQNIGSGILDIDTIKSITDSLDGLNDAQKSLYKAMLLEYSVDLLLSDKESRGRKIGATTAHFIGFMTELMVGTGLIKASESKAISEFVKRGSSKALSQAQQTTLRKFINSTTRVAKNIFKEATRTTGVLAPSVSRDMARATAPTVDSEGNIQYQDAKDRTKSMSSSLAMSYISNLGLAIGGKVQKVAMTEFGKVNSAIFAKLTQGKDIVPISADAAYKFGKFINNNVIAHTSLATMDITSKAMGELLGLTPGAITSYDTDEAINVLIASVISGKVIHSVSKPKTPIYYKEQKARMQQAIETLDNTLKIFFPSMSEAQRGEFLRNYTEGTLEGGATKVFKSILSIGKDAVQQLQIKYKENIANLTKRRNEVLNSEYYSRNHQERLKVLESINKEAQIINAEYQKAVYNIQNQLAFIADAKLEDYAVKYGIYGKTVVQEGVNNEPSNEKSPQGAKATAETSVLYLTPENAKTFAPSIERTRGKVDDVTVESFSQDIDNKINQVQEPQDAATISAILTESMSYGALWVENAITEIGRENIGAQYDNSLNRLIAQLTSHYKGEKSPEEVVRVLASMNGKDYIEYSTRILSEIAPEGYQNTLSALSDFATISRAIVMADAYLASKPNEQGVTPSEEVENAEVNQFATYANEDGVVMPIKTSGGVGYVKKGKVVLDEKGNIDRDNSSKEIYYMNEKGEVDVADINAISIDNINPLFNKTPEEIVKEMTAVAEPQAIPMGESVTYIGSNGQDVTSKVVGNDEVGNIILENGDAITPNQVEIHTPTAKYKEGDEVVLDSDEVAILSMAPDGTYIANTQGGQRPVTEAEILGTVEEVDSMKAAQLPTVEAPTLETKNVVPETEAKVEEIDYEKLATTDPLRFIQEYDKVFGEGEGVKALQDVVTTLESTIQANQEKLMSPKTGLNDKVRLKKEIDEIQKSLDIVKGGIPQAKPETPMEVISYAPETISEAEPQEEIPEGPSYAPIKEKWDNAKKIEGVKDELVLPNGDKLPGRYVMTEVGSYAPSHNPHKNFAMTEGFPTTQEGTTVNDRDYASDKNAQALVEKRSASYDQRAITNPVVVSQDGIVLSGNDRTMAGELAAVNNTDSKYVEYLQNYGGKYGFTPEQVGEFEHPRVVFVPDEALPYTTEVFGRFNAKETKSQSKTESAIKIGKSIKDVTVNKITTTLAEHEKIQDFFASDKDVNAVISTLVEDGMLLENEVAEMYDGDKLSIVGRDYLETIFLGMVLPEESVRMSSEIPSIRQTILSAIPALADNSRIENGYALTKELGEAISMLYRARKAGVKQGESLDDYTRQSDLFLGTPPLHTLVAKEMALKMNSKSKTSFRDFVLAYNRSATPASKGQVDIFYGRPLMREEIMQDLVNASARFQLTTPTPSRGIYGAELTGHKESVFESNAMIALNTIKQNKATGAQWLAMLQKAGGIKAGEDKWIGLSDFLTENKERSLTREEIASFITENGIRLEEVVYADYSEGYNERIDEALEPYQEEFEELMAEGEEVTGSIFTSDHADYAFQKMVEKYGDDFKYGFEWEGGGYPRLSVQMDIDDEPSESALIFLNKGMMPPGVKPIDSTRLRYTTEGLSNKKELAFVVPTIKSWDQNDKVHFGDAGEGRNIGWVRFGDGTYMESERMDFSFENFDKPYQNTNGENVYTNPKRKKDYVVERTDPKTGKMWYGIFIKEHYSGKMVESLDKAKEEMNQHYATNNDTALRSRSVLMIDEIQSNRHQEGRQKGYSNITEKEQTRLNELRKELQALGKELGDISEEIVIALMPKDAYYHLRHLSLNDNIRRVMLKDESTATSYRPLITIYGRQFYTDKEEVETLIRLAEQLRPLVLEEDRRDIDMFLEEMSQRDMHKLDTLYEREQELENKKDTIIKGEEWSTLTNKATRGIPAAPFEKNWAELIMKRMLRYAAENGYSRIAWTTGAQQADRYNMSTYMDTVKLTKREDGTYLLNGENNGVDVYGGIHTAEELSNLIGKEASLRWIKIADAAYEKVQPLREAADNLRSQADKEGYIRVTDHPEYGDKWEKLQDDIADINRECTHSGEDLAIGGEGMKAFYDVMLPSFVGKYGKKWGVNVEDISVSVGGGITVHSVKITDKMREDLQNPQPLFQVAPTQFNLIAPRVSRERIEPLVNRLKESGLAKDVIFVESEKDVQKYINIDESIKATVRGRMAAVTDDSGNIVIVEDNLRLDTPFHEYCHKLWSYAKETKRVNAIQAFKKIAENTPEHIKRFIDRNYGGLTYEAYCNEAFAWHTASKSSERMKEFLRERELDKRTSSEQLQDYEWYQNITREIESVFKSLAKDYVEETHSVYGVAPTTLAKVEDDELSVFDAYEEMSVEQLISAVYDVLMSGKRKQLQNDTPVEVMSQRSNESLITVHNITQEKLENALRLGGLANPSMATYDTSISSHEGFGEISFILPSEKLEGVTTFSRDAWTPKFPRVEYSFSDKARAKYKEILMSVKDEELRRVMGWYLSAYLNESGPTSSPLAPLYLQEKGIPFSPARKQGRYRDQIHHLAERIFGGEVSKEAYDTLSKDQKAEYFLLINGKLTGSEIDSPSYVDVLKNRIESNKERLSHIKDNPDATKDFVALIERRINENEALLELAYEADMTNVAIDMYQDKHTNRDLDAYKTFDNAEMVITEQGLLDEFNDWQDSMIDKIAPDKVFFSHYTPSGNSKYKPYTLDEVSKWMNKQGLNASDFGNQTGMEYFLSHMVKKMKSRAAIRKNRSMLVSNEDMIKWSENANEVYHDAFWGIMNDGDLAKRYGNDYIVAEQVAFEIMQDAIIKKRPISTIEKEYKITLSDATRQAISDFATEAKNAVDNYFETKFQRPVYFNEFAAVVIPKDAKASLKERLEEEGVAVYEYDPNLPGNRSEVIDEATRNRNDVLFQFLGETGAGNLDRYDESTLRLDNLNIAREMERQGKDAASIKHATGWERGKDEKWRYEIVDDFSGIESLWDRYRRLEKEYDEVSQRYERMSYQPLTTPKGAGEEVKKLFAAKRKKFKEVIKELNEKRDAMYDADPQKLINLDEYLGKDNLLFTAYPQLRKIQISSGFRRYYIDKGYGGYFDGSQIWISPYTEDYKSALIHEIQHAIQYIEGFAKGGSVETAGTIADRLLRDAAAVYKKMYASSSWQEREKLVSQTINEGVSDEVWSRIQELDKDKGVQEILELQHTFGRKYGNTAPVIDILSKPTQLDDEAWSNLFPRFYDPYEAYRSLAGETEARNVSKRMNMTEEERRKSLAEETEDVSREDQEVIFGRLGGIGMASASGDVRDVIDEAKAKGNYLKAPNGKESNLASLPNTWAQTRTVPFKEWFGDWKKLSNFVQTLNDKDYERKKLLYQRFSPEELRDGDRRAEEAEIILQGGKNSSIPEAETTSTGNIKKGLKQEKELETWAKAEGIWIDNTTKALTNSYGKHYDEGGEAIVYDNGETVVKEISLAYFIEPQLALDRIILHNYVSDAKLTIKSFGRNSKGEFVIIVEQPYVSGEKLSQSEIIQYMASLGFKPYNRRNTEFSNGKILINDLHDENVIKRPNGSITIIDADFRLNTPNLKAGGIRTTRYDLQNQIKTLQSSVSKIIDENGEPLIVYHGSGKWFEEFDPNAPKHSGAYDNTFYFTDNKEIANSFVPGRWFGVSHGEKSGMAKEVILDPDSPKHPKYAWGTHREGGIYSVFLNMRKPFVVDFKGKPWYDMGNGDSLDDIANKVRLEGKYDGVIAKNIKDVGHNDYQLEKLPNVTVYVTFKPEQAKSATQNEGTFDNENKKLRFRTSEQLFKEPTEAQKKAGNYKMEHLRRGGYNISIENPKGSVRRGTDENGVKWENEMPYDYGYIRGTKGKDGDHIDIFLGPIEDPLEVYVVDQINPKTGKFDESKVMFGFASIDEARRAYEAAYDKDWKGLDKITATTKETFDEWIDSRNKQSKPFSEYVLIEKTKRQEEAGPLRDYEEQAKEVCKVINSDIVIIRDINEIKDSNPINEAKKRGSKGWYDPTEGKTYIVLPNAESVEDVKETVMHENLGHRSLREMLGDKADAFFRSVYRGMSIDAKAKYMGQENAAEEYVADMAQTYTKPSQWARIKAMFRALLRKLGINIKMTDADIRYYLYKACKHGKKRTLIEETEVKATEYELNKARQNPRYRVIGEKGVSTVASTKELHLTDNLAKAKELYSIGANPEKIQRMTGWYMAKDGKWRIERSDRDLVINLESITREAVRARRDVLNKIGEYEKALDEGMDPISTEMDNMAMDVENLKAMYEEQYGIISDFENATKGEVVSAMLHMGISMKEILKGSGILEEYPALGEYTLMVNDYMPQGTVGSYDPLYKTITLSSRLFNKYSKEEIERASSELMHEIQHFIQDEEGFMSGGSTRGVAKVKESLKKQIDIALRGELKRKGSLYALLGDSNISEEVYDTLERIAKENSFADSEELIQFLTEEDYDSYTSLLGEVEARRVERRRWMTEEEIKQIDEVYEKEMVLSYALNIPDKAMNEDSRSYRRFKLIEEVDRLMNGLGKVTEKHKRHIVVQYIKNYLTKNDMYNFSKGDLARVLGWVEKAPSRRDFHHALSVLYFEVARLGYQQSIRKIRALKAKKLDGDKNGVSQARSVDASTREFFRLFTEKTGPAMRRLGNPVDVLERELYNDSNGEPTGIEADLSRLADLLAKDPTSNEYRISYQDALYKKAALNLAIRYEEALDTRDVIMRQLSAIQHEWETLRGIYNRMKANGATPYDVELYKAKMSRVADERIALSEEMAALSDEMEEIAQTLNRALQEGIMNLENEVIAREDERILNIQRALQSLGTKLYMGEYKSPKDKVKEGAIKAWHTAYMPIFNMTNTLRFISGRKYPEGKSPMWRFYTEQGMKASEAYYNHTTELARRIENKSIELFNLRFRDVASRAKAKIGIEVSDRELAYVDEATATGQSLHTQSVGGKGHPIELTMDAALYILGLTRNPEIKERYIARGISDDKLMEIRNAVLQQPNGDKYLQLLDWIQFELIPSTRGRYNATHRLLNGRNMAHVVNYLPLKVRKADQTPKQDALAGNQNMPRSVEETGHIKNRQSTKAIPSLTQGILEYLPSYIQKMEEWDAYALFGRSVNDILKSKEFRNRMEANMPGMYNILADAFQVATGAYSPAEEFNNRIYKFLEKARSRVVAANIAYNMIPAIKQLLSYPSVFDSYNTLSFYKMMAKYSNPVDNIKWVMDGNLPLLKKRWEQGIAGFQELQWQGGSFITGPIIKFLRDLWVKKKGDVADWVLSAAEFMRDKAGMLPNRAIDVFTCSMVARPVYEETYRRMKKRGATDEEAKKEAEYMATLTYNASQQSNERWITSPMQNEKGWAKILTTYQNTNIQQQALLQLAYMELKKNKKVEIKQKEEEYIIAYKRKGYSDEEAKKEAHKEATAEVNEIKRKAWMNVFLYGNYMKFLWGLGGVMFLSILTGDDREKKFKSALTPGQYVLQGIGQGSAFWVPLELSVDTWQYSSQVEFRPDMLADFINENIKIFSDEEKDWSDKVFAAISLLLAYDAGLDLRKLRNMFFSLQNLPKALEYEKGGRDIMLQVLNLSPSQRKRILMQKLDGETHEEYQERVSDMADILYQIEVKEDEIKQKYIEKRLEEVADQKGELDDYVAVKTYVDETLKERGISKSGSFGTQDKKEEANKRRDNIELVKLLKRNQATMKKLTFKVNDLSDKDYRELYEDFYQNLLKISTLLESMPK